MAALADYEFYTDTYKGALISAADFDRYALDASTEVECQTFERASAIIDAGTELPLIEKIKMATCAVAETLFRQDNDASGAAAIASESVGNYSVSYALAADASMTKAQKIESVLRRYLGNTGLMYRGVE